MSQLLDSGSPAAGPPDRASTASTASTAEPAQRSSNSWWHGLRPLLRRLHFYAGMFVGPFLFVAALSGLLYTITPQLDELVYHDALHAQPSSGPSTSLADQVSAAAAAVPGGTVTEIRPPKTPGATTWVSFDAPGVREDFSRTAFVDPGTGRVRAVLDTYGGDWLPVRAWFDELHRTLHLGDVGRVYSELAASWLWVLALSGLTLWIVRRRRRARIRRTLLPEPSAPRGRRLRSWHAAVGLWAAVGLLFLSATGLTWSQFAGENVTTLRASLSWSTPTVSKTLPGPAADAGPGQPVAPGPPLAPSPPATPGQLGAEADRALGGARTAGLSDPVVITPAKPGAAWTIKQNQRSWPEKQDAVAVDPRTGQVLDTVRFADWPVAAKLARWGVDAHMGLLFGWVSQLALAALAAAVLCLVVWGYRMWWKRRPSGGGVAGPPGGGTRPGPGAVTVVAVLAIVVGVFLPVLGVSLLVFLLGDLALGVARAVTGRRGRDALLGTIRG